MSLWKSIKDWFVGGRSALPTVEGDDRDRRSVDAVHFVRYAIQVARQDPELFVDRQISPASICKVLLELSIDEFGSDAERQLRSWNLPNSREVGLVTQALLDGKLIDVTISGTPPDFDGHFDFDQPQSTWGLKW